MLDLQIGGLARAPWNAWVSYSRYPKHTLYHRDVRTTTISGINMKEHKFTMSAIACRNWDLFSCSHP